MTLAAIAYLFGCTRPGPSFEDIPVRPMLDQIVVTGEMALDASMDRTIRKGRVPRKEVRRPLSKVYPLLKGSDVQPGRIVSYVPLTSGLSSAPCEGKTCPGRVELAEMLPQAGVDIVGTAAPLVADQGAREETEATLAAMGVCPTHGSPCVEALDDTRVAVVDIAAVSETDDAPERARQAVATAREAADVVVLSVKLSARTPRTERNALLRSISEAADSDVVVGHHLGPLDGVEVHEGHLILHNPGPLLHAKPGDARENAVVYRLHVDREGVRWLEAIPVRLRNGRVRPAFLEETGAALGRLTKRSSAPGLHVEFGRAILDADSR